MIPNKRDFEPREWRVIQNHRTPPQVQRFIRTIPYNREIGGETCFSFRRVLRENRAHCLEGALVAAVILEQHGYPPLLLSIESQDRLDHVILLYKRNGRFGSVARSRDLGLHGRKPVFRTVRNLVMSYLDPYVDKTGRITGYGVADLRDLHDYDWRLATRNVRTVERHLQEIPHKKVHMAEARYQKWHRRYTEFRQMYPDLPVDHFPNRHLWQL